MSSLLSTEALPPLPYGRQWIDADDVSAVVECLQGDWLTQGPSVSAFEAALAETCGSRFAVAVSNGTAALHLAALAADLGPGQVGYTSPITFVASANCLAYCGATPAFVDIDPRTVTLDPEALESACRRQKPAAVIPVDFSGQPADLPAIYDIAKRHGAVVIQDAAHSLGADYTSGGRTFRAGSCEHADMAILSFHPVKHITSGEGGAVLTNDPAYYARLMELRTHGITKDPAKLTRNDGPWYYEQHDLGYNYRITDLQCALGMSQLGKLPAFIERRRELVRLYEQALAELAPDVELLLESEGRRSAYHLMVMRLRGGAARRLAVFEFLQSRGIRAQVHYIPVHLQPWYQERFGYRAGDFPHAEAYYASCISLPLFPRMSNEDVDRTVAVVREAVTVHSA